MLLVWYCQMSKKRISVHVHKLVLRDPTFPWPWGAVRPWTNSEISPCFISHIWNGYNMIYILKIATSQQNWYILKRSDQLWEPSFSIWLRSGHSTYFSKLALVFSWSRGVGQAAGSCRLLSLPRMKPREVWGSAGSCVCREGRCTPHALADLASPRELPPEQFNRFRSSESWVKKWIFFFSGLL